MAGSPGPVILSLLSVRSATDWLSFMIGKWGGYFLRWSTSFRFFPINSIRGKHFKQRWALASEGVRRRFERVLFEGGTFSAHPLYMKAGSLMLKYLVDNADMIYPKIASAGDKLRKGIEEVFGKEGIEVKCTGYGNEVIPRSSLFMVNFPLKRLSYKRPEELANEELSNVRLREEVLKLALLEEKVHVIHGGGAVSFAHKDNHIEKTIAAYAKVARLFKKYLH